MKNYKRTFAARIEAYVDNDVQYNYGGDVPGAIFLPPPSPSPTGTGLPTPTPSITPTLTTTPTPTPSITPTLTRTQTPTPTRTGTPTPTTTTTRTPTPTPTATPPGFEPDDITGLVAWWKSTDGVVFGGGGITAWNDVVSGNTATALNADRFNRSTDVLNGYTGITQTGLNTYMTLGTQINLVNWAVFIVVKVNTTKVVNYFMGNTSGEGIGARQTASGTGPIIFLNPGILTGGSNLTTAQYLSFNRLTSTAIIRQNGTQVASGAMAADTLEFNTFFEGNIGSGLSLAGTIWEMCVYNSSLTAGQITQVENYFKAKYNL